MWVWSLEDRLDVDGVGCDDFVVAGSEDNDVGSDKEEDLGVEEEEELGDSVDEEAARQRNELELLGEYRFKPGSSMVFSGLITLLFCCDEINMPIEIDAFTPQIAPVTLHNVRFSTAQSDAYIEPLETTFVLQALAESRLQVREEFAALKEFIRTSLGATMQPQQTTDAPSTSRACSDPNTINSRIFMDH